MKTYLTTTLAWPTVSSLFYLFTSVDAGFVRHDLEARDNVVISQLYSNDSTAKYGYHLMDATEVSKVTYLFSCYNDFPVREWTEDGIRYVACCNHGRYLPVIGTVATKLLCCGPDERYTETTTIGTAYVCKPTGSPLVDLPAVPIQPGGTAQQPLSPSGGTNSPGGPGNPASPGSGNTGPGSPDNSGPGSPGSGNAGPSNSNSPGSGSPGTGIPGNTGKCDAGSCSSDVYTGKNYQLINWDGKYWEHTQDNHSPPTEQTDQNPSFSKTGTFKFCKDEACNAITDINPADVFTIKDINGNPPSGAKADSWVYNYAGPDQITRTYQYPQAGNFSVTKWPGGKYCIGAVNSAGSNAIYPDKQAGMALGNTDSQFCVEVELKEVTDTGIPMAQIPVVATTTQTAIVTSTETVKSCPTLAGGAVAFGPGSFACDGTAYYITSANNIITLYSIDLQTAGTTLIATNVGAGIYTNLDAMGFNSRDNFLYGIATIKPGSWAVVRISTGGALTEVVRFDNMLHIGTAGDFDLEGQFWTSAKGEYWMQIDLLPGSPTYGTIVNQGASTIENYSAFDWAYLPGQGKYLYSMVRSTVVNPSFAAVLRFSLTSHTWEVVREFPDVMSEHVVANWGGNDGTIWSMTWVAGKLARYKLGEPAPVDIGFGVTGLQNGDGARCALAS